MHELEMINGEAQMAWAESGGVPWHGLGVKVSDDMSPEQMMQAAGLDWNVRELATYAEMRVDGKKRRIPTGMKALVRETDGKMLTQVGKNWNPVQNADAFDFFTEFVEAGDMQMHTAGSLKGGQIVWALAKVDDDFELFGGDKVESYLLFTNPHQYGKVIDVRFTPIRVVCNNTLTLSLAQRANQQFKLNHSRVFDPEQAKEALGLAHVKMSRYKEMAEFLGSKQASKKVLKEYFGELLGTSTKEDKDLSRNGEKAMELFETQPGAEYAKGSFWNAYNTVTYMTDHVLGRSNDTRLESAWYGLNAKKKTHALDLALEMAEAA